MTVPSLSHYVNDAGAYVLAVSAVPEEHLHRPLIVIVGDDTLVDQTTPPPTDTGWCPWCEEAEAPAYLAHDVHDPRCPLQATARTAAEA